MGRKLSQETKQKIKDSLKKVKLKECPKCGRKCRPSNIQRHVKSCGKHIKKFSPKDEWKVGENKYECPYCKKQFKKLGIGNHIFRQHTKEGRSIKIPSWNKGLTQETDDRVARVTRRLQRTMKEKAENGELRGCFSKEYFGSNEHLKNSAKGGGYHKNLGRGRQGSYKGIWCDSSWELAFVVYHLEHGIPFERNWKKFKYIFDGVTHTYIPDFVYPDGTYIEVKGYFDKRSQEKLKQFRGKISLLQHKDMENMLYYTTLKYGKDFIHLYDTPE